MAGVKGMHKRASTSPTTAAAIRSRIQAGVITDRLVKHVLGTQEMSKSQVSAGLGLLKKVVPDLSQVHGAGEEGQHKVEHRIEVVIVDAP